jgi:hypothetical protein
MLIMAVESYSELGNLPNNYVLWSCCFQLRFLKRKVKLINLHQFSLTIQYNWYYLSLTSFYLWTALTSLPNFVGRSWCFLSEGGLKLFELYFCSTFSVLMSLLSSRAFNHVIYIVGRQFLRIHFFLHYSMFLWVELIIIDVFTISSNIIIRYA